MFCPIVGIKCQDTHCILCNLIGVEIVLALNCAKLSDYILNHYVLYIKNQVSDYHHFKKYQLDLELSRRSTISVY